MDLTPWEMAEKFGWTLDYIDSLPLSAFAEFEEYLVTADGLRKAYAYLQKSKRAPMTKK